MEKGAIGGRKRRFRQFLLDFIGVGFEAAIRRPHISVLKADDRLEFVRLAALIAQHHGFSALMSRYNAAMTLACVHIVSLPKL